jgi:hypothetical protein
MRNKENYSIFLTMRKKRVVLNTLAFAFSSVSVAWIIFTFFVVNKHNLSDSFAGYNLNKQPGTNATQLNFDPLRFTTAFDKECEANGEWELLKLDATRNLFFKRSAAFYFLDADLMRIHFTTSFAERWLFDKRLVLRAMFHDPITGHLVTIKTHALCSRLHSQRGWSNYEVYFVDAALELRRKHNVTMQHRIQLKVVVVDTVSGRQLTRPLNVIVKHLSYDAKANEKQGGVMHCGKCLHLTRRDDLVDLEWWIRLMRAAGYEKTVLCDHAIEKHADFDELFRRNKYTAQLPFILFFFRLLVLSGTRHKTA